jgi:hypothetical protein
MRNYEQGSHRRQTVATRRAAAPRGTDSKPACPRSGERSYANFFSLDVDCGRLLNAHGLNRDACGIFLNA